MTKENESELISKEDNENKNESVLKTENDEIKIISNEEIKNTEKSEILNNDSKVKNVNKIKNTKEIELVRIVKPILFLLCAIALEIVFQETTTGEFLPKWFLFDLSIFLLFAGIMFAIPKNWINNILFVLFLLPQMILNVTIITLRNGIDDYFIFDMLSVVAEGISVFNFYYLPLELITAYVVFVFILILVLIHLDKYLKMKVEILSLKKFSIDLMVLCSTILFLMVTYLTQILIIQNSKQKNVLSSPKELWNGNVISGGKSLKTFGLYGFYINNFYTTYLKNEKFDEQFLLKYVADGEVKVNENATLFDDNLIMINVESLDSFAIDPYNTPNLWNLTHGNSVYMSEFYGKNQTNVSETISMLGYMPNYSVYDSEKGALSSKYTLANLFNNQGYKTNYFHPFYGDFYSRDKMKDTMGFQNLYFGTDVEHWAKTTNKFSLSLTYPENEFFEYFKEEMIPTDGSKFFSYYMTVATHGGYTYNERFEKYYQKFDENYEKFREWFDTETNYTYPELLEVKERFENFKAQCIETDEMIGNMIKYLEETEVNGKKLIDNTTIVLFADHDCYYHTMSSFLKANTGKDDMYNIPMLIYSKKLENRTIDKFCSTYDIYPTVCELYGLAYNKNMCMGQNILSETFDSIFYSTKDSVGFIDEKYKLLRLDELSIRNEASNEIEEEFFNKANKFMEKQKYLNQIYKSGLKC